MALREIVTFDLISGPLTVFDMSCCIDRLKRNINHLHHHRNELTMHQEEKQQQHLLMHRKPLKTKITRRKQFQGKEHQCLAQMMRLSFFERYLANYDDLIYTISSFCDFFLSLC